MLRHGGAPIWTALSVKTGEITGTGISFPRTHPNLKKHVT